MSPFVLEIRLAPVTIEISLTVLIPSMSNGTITPATLSVPRSKFVRNV